MRRWEAALAVARDEVGPAGRKCDSAIVALGKTGGQELNYVSDVDVLYVGEPALDEAGEPACSSGEAITVATKLVGALTRVCSAYTAAGTIWELDAALRPEGKAGPLVRTLASHLTYYQKWAKNWEFQAMLKARPMAGDRALAQDFVDLVSPMVWRVAENDQFVSETQAMRRRVIALLPPREADREIKLGAGGLRDVEFSVQLIQLVHGRADDRVRQAGTLAALAKLIEHGYVGRSDGGDLDAAYRLMRLLEHRIQLEKMRRTHLMPDDELSLRRLGARRGTGRPGGDDRTLARGQAAGAQAAPAAVLLAAARGGGEDPVRGRPIDLLRRRGAARGPWVTPTHRPPSGTSRPCRKACRDRPRSSANSCPRCSVGSPPAPTPTMRYWRSAKCRRPWDAPTGTCGRCVTVTRWPNGWPGSCRPAATPWT